MGKNKKGLTRILWRNKIESIGLVWVIVVLCLTVLGPWISPFSPTDLDLSHKFIKPNSIHWFGTDAMGRDILSRVIVGTRVSMKVALCVILTSVVVGVTVGLLAGLNGGIVDEILMRITDVFLSFPPLILAMAVAAALGSGLTAAIIGLAITWWPGYARLIRAQVLTIKSEGYVESARAVGSSILRVAFQHILLNAIDPLIIQITLDVGYVTLAAAGLGFIGVGAQPPTPEWGTMIATGREYILTKGWVSMFPGLALLVTVLSFNLFGDMLRSELDPRMHQHSVQSKQ